MNITEANRLNALLDVLLTPGADAAAWQRARAAALALAQRARAQLGAGYDEADVAGRWHPYEPPPAISGRVAPADPAAAPGRGAA